MLSVSRNAVRALMVVAGTMLAMTATAQANAPETGKVRFVKEANSDFDSYTQSPSAQQAGWMREHFYRQKTYAPYFDERTSWYPNAWAYKDLYAIYLDDNVAREHPDWILKDGHGQKLYIPWGCEGGTCPQYAADVGNPEFRQYWISQAREALAAGYKGLFVDDVNMEFRVGNGNGDEVAPVDPRTGATMSHTAWRRYVAEFAELIRTSFPDTEVAHNPIWYSGHEDQYVRRALLAADYVDLERGVNDDGLRRGGGEFGLETFLKHVDWLHEHGKAVIFDSYVHDRTGAEYNLASYFLVNGTRDGFRTDYRTVPDNWWTGYDVDLGAATGPRYEWNGLLRRDFERGYVLVNQPESGARTIHLGAGARGPDGAPRSSIRLGAAQGAVVLGHAPSRGGSIFLRSLPNPTRAIASASRRAWHGHRRIRGAVLIRGRIRGTSSAGRRVRVEIRRKVGRRWVRVRSARARVGRKGTFRKLFKHLSTGRYRARARYAHGSRHIAISTRRFRIRGA